jgi:hypothetical protein
MAQNNSTAKTIDALKSNAAKILKPVMKPIKKLPWSYGIMQKLDLKKTKVHCFYRTRCEITDLMLKPVFAECQLPL